jgi:hypothetical protein
MPSPEAENTTLPEIVGLAGVAKGGQCMSPRSVQLLWDNDMYQNKSLKRVA